MSQSAIDLLHYFFVFDKDFECLSLLVAGGGGRLVYTFDCKPERVVDCTVVFACDFVILGSEVCPE